MKAAHGRVIAATFFHAPSLGKVEILEAALVTVDERGTISSVERRDSPAYQRLHAEAAAAGTLETVASGSYVLPGFVDLHIHAPQYPQLGKALDCPLDEWLARYTFLLEARYADLEFAHRAYHALVAGLAANRTTTPAMHHS